MSGPPSPLVVGAGVGHCDPTPLYNITVDHEKARGSLNVGQELRTKSVLR